MQVEGASNKYPQLMFFSGEWTKIILELSPNIHLNLTTAYLTSPSILYKLEKSISKLRGMLNYYIFFTILIIPASKHSLCRR